MFDILIIIVINLFTNDYIIIIIKTNVFCKYDQLE